MDIGDDELPYFASNPVVEGANLPIALVAALNALAGFFAIPPLAGWETAHETVQVTMQAMGAIVYIA